MRWLSIRVFPKKREDKHYDTRHRQPERRHGQTTAVVSLDIGLARAERNVLLADYDPQGSLTVSNGYSQSDEPNVTLMDLLVGVLMDKPAPKQGILHYAEGVSLIPINILLSR